MGWTNADNKFGPSQFVVGTSLGDGVNYISIQAAIDDAFNTVGGGAVLIRRGVYTEDLNLRDEVDLIGVNIDGNIQRVRIVGSHTMPSAGTSSCSNIFFASPIDAFTLGTGGSNFLTLQNCGVQATNFAFNLNGPVGVGSVTLENCNVVSDNYTIQCTSNANFTIKNSSLLSNGAGTIFISPGVLSCGGFIEHSSLVSAASPCIDFQDAVANVSSKYSYFEAPNQPISFNAAATFSAYQNSYKNGTASGEYIVGPGIYTYGGDIIDPAQSSGIDPAATQVKLNSRPYAETGTGAASDIRGSACFDGLFFTSTDGYVTYGGSIAHSPIYELDADSGSAVPLGPFGVQVNVRGKAGCTTEASTNNMDIYAVKYTSIIASGAAVPDFGHWITTTVTTTLPAAPDEGTIVSFIITNAGAIQTVQAPGSARIRLGNQLSSAGGTATSTDIGDHLRLVYRIAPSDTWFAEEIVGNWTVA